MLRIFWNWLRPRVPWTLIRVFGSLTYFNISYGVLLLVPILHELYARSVPVMVWFGAPGEFPSSLQWLYAASLAYAIAIPLYQLCCPTSVKRFKERDDFAEWSSKNYRESDPHHKLEIVLARLHPEDEIDQIRQISELHRQSREGGSASERADAEKRLNELLDKLHPHALQKLFRKEYQDSNISWPIARWISFALYVLGSLILLVLLLERSVAVFTDYREGRMVIYSNIVKQELHLRAYTFVIEEFSLLETVLKQVDIPISFSSIDRDAQNRTGRDYSVPSPAIPRLGTALNGTFDTRGRFSPIVGAGKPYACKEKKLGGSDGVGCQDIVASDDTSATVECSLIAGNQGWHFGKAVPGRCKSP